MTAADLMQVERYSHMPDHKLGWQPGDAWGHRRTGYKKMAHMLGGQPLAAWEATYSREPQWTRHIRNDTTPEIKCIVLLVDLIGASQINVEPHEGGTVHSCWGRVQVAGQS